MEKEKKKFSIRFTIGNKILAGFLIADRTVHYQCYRSYFLRVTDIDTVVAMSSENIRPSKDAINELILICHPF
jgi:hypothetical protein